MLPNPKASRKTVFVMTDRRPKEQPPAISWPSLAERIVPIGVMKGDERMKRKASAERLLL
jgi:hypothetical protein